MGKANKHKPFNKEAAKAYGGSLKHFIKTIPPKKKPGRPPKKSKGRGRPPRKSTPDVMNADRTVAAATVATVDNEGEEVEDNDGNDEAERPKKKKSRTNWGAPANRQRIEKAISDYLNKEGNAIDRNGVFIENRTIYAGLVGISFNTLYRYIHPYEEKRQKLGNGERGRKKLIDGENCDFVAETLARQDRCNDGASRKEAIDIIMDIEPDLTRKQASRQLSRVILPVRRVAMTILNSHGGKYTSQCLRALKTECKLNLNQLTEIRVCMIIAKEHPETLDMDLDDIQNESGANESTNNNPDMYSSSDPQVATMEEARTEDQNLNKCLDYYQLNPKDSSGKQKFSGEALLNHLCGYRNREFAKEGSTDDDRTSKLLLCLCRHHTLMCIYTMIAFEQLSQPSKTSFEGTQ